MDRQLEQVQEKVAAFHALRKRASWVGDRDEALRLSGQMVRAWIFLPSFINETPENVVRRLREQLASLGDNDGNHWNAFGVGDELLHEAVSSLTVEEVVKLRKGSWLGEGYSASASIRWDKLLNQNQFLGGTDG
jgi:hypothetical protein